MHTFRETGARFSVHKWIRIVVLDTKRVECIYPIENLKRSICKEQEMYRTVRMLCFLTILGILGGHVSNTSAQDTVHDEASQSFTLWQLPNQAPPQMMSYVIQSKGGKLIVIDGGRDSDAGYLRRFIHERGGKVETWFITHPHDDHLGALTRILLEPEGIEPGTIYASLPDSDWMLKTGDMDGSYVAFKDAIAKTQREVNSLTLAQIMEVDGIVIQVLGIRNPEILKNAINNSSVVLRIHDARKSMLFLADLGLEGGEKLLQSPLAEHLPSDYVQMAHHGQNGVGEEVYQRIKPQYCLWPTPLWLWDNNSGAGKGSGSWKTLEVREWMDRLGVQKHYVLFEGLQVIE